MARFSFSCLSQICQAKKKLAFCAFSSVILDPPMSNHALSWTPFASSPGRPIVNFPPAPSFASAEWASAYNFAQPCGGCDDVTQSYHPQAFFGSPLTLDLGLAEWRSFHAPRSFMKNEKKKQAVSTMQKAPVEELQQQTAANLNKGSVQNAATRGPLD